MPPGKFTKRDLPQEQYRIPTKIELLSKLAEERPYGIGGKEEPSITEAFFDPIPQPPIGKVAKLAITLPFAKQQILKIPRAGLSALQQREVMDTLKVLAATPKRALQSISNLTVESPEMFKNAADIIGHWTFGREIRLMPLVKSEKLPESFQRFLQRAEEKGLRYTLPEATSHELGHEITERLLRKRGQTLLKLYPGSFNEPMWEGVAEYLGKNISKKANVPFTPRFSYGPEQELIFNVLKRAPSKNPYMNVFRFLQKSGELK